MGTVQQKLESCLSMQIKTVLAVLGFVVGLFVGSCSVGHECCSLTDAAILDAEVMQDG